MERPMSVDRAATHSTGEDPLMAEPETSDAGPDPLAARAGSEIEPLLEVRDLRVTFRGGGRTRTSTATPPASAPSNCCGWSGYPRRGGGTTNTRTSSPAG